MQVRFELGSIIVDAPRGETRLPDYFRWDERARVWRAFAAHYSHFRRYARQNVVGAEFVLTEFPRLERATGASVELRDYQQEAAEAWRRAQGRGVVVLPTGSGKTRLALHLIARTAKSCLVVVPTLELLAQWYGLLSDAFEGEVGRLGGGEHEVRPLTVTTYDSAYRWIDRYGDRFALLVFDEVHHLPASSYVHIAQMSLAPYRLGLTATLERVDFRHVLLSEWVGPVVFRKAIDEMSGEALSTYETELRRVELTTSERSAFEEAEGAYKAYLKEEAISGRNSFNVLLDRAPYDPNARKALAGFQSARKIILNAEAKVNVTGELLARYANCKILIFTETNDLVYRLSKHFLIPAITHLTSPKERRWILKSFRDGQIRAIVTSKVLNEGVDVPEANVAIVLGGSGSRREHVQRLGRILRPAPEKRALLIEVVTKQERALSYRRRNDSAFKQLRPKAQGDLFDAQP